MARDVRGEFVSRQTGPVQQPVSAWLQVALILFAVWAALVVTPVLAAASANERDSDAQPDGGDPAATPPRSPRDPFDGDPATTERTDTDDPAAAAIAVSQIRFPAGQSAASAVLSRVDEFPDSLAATPLTADAPLLLTATGALNDATRNELRRVLVPGATVYLLGGDQALSPAVQQAIAQDGFRPQRLSGAGRVETAIQVADEILRRTPDQRTAVLARAAGPPDNVTAGWADSVTIGAWTAGGQVPLLITPTDQLAPAVDEWLDTNGIETTIVVGGASAVTDAVAAQAPGPRRIFGDDRAATAAAISAELIDGDPARIIVLNGYREDGWAFGLPAAGLAADFDAPILVAGDAVPGPTAALASTPCDSPPAVDALLLGSPAVLGPAVVEQLDLVDGGPCPPPPPPPLVCDSDASGDAEDPRADVLEICASYGDLLRVQLRVADPTDPNTDPAWTDPDRFSYIFFSIDTDGGQTDVEEFDVGYANIPGEGLVAFVYDPDTGDTICDGRASYDGTFYIAESIPADCIGAPGSLLLQGGIRYDTGPIFHGDQTSFPPDFTVVRGGG